MGGHIILTIHPYGCAKIHRIRLTTHTTNFYFEVLEDAALSHYNLGSLISRSDFIEEKAIPTWGFSNPHVENKKYPRGREKILRRNQMKLRRNRFASTWRIKNIHVGI